MSENENDRRREYRREVMEETEEFGWTLRTVAVRVLLPIIILCLVLGGLGYVFGWFGEAAEVAQEQFGARPALAKYEWFIDQSANIAKMDQDVANFRQRAANVEEQYAGYGPQAAWPIDVRLQYNRAREHARDDLVAVISQRNNLVREYNAASAKFNWAPFRTRPDMPAESFKELTAP